MRGTTALAIAGLFLGSCVVHGQSSRFDPEVHRSYTPYIEEFYRELMTGRVNLFEGIGRYRNVVAGQIYGADGTLIECLGRRRLDNRLHWVKRTSVRWSLVRHSRRGVRTEWDYGGGLKKYASQFYDPETGAFSTEILHKGSYLLANPAQIQDTWPRALADACPDLKLPAHIRINEKQTSLRMDELRRQDPDAPIRHFPGSHLTAPGRTGLGASDGRPTTTKEEVWAYLNAQEGNVLIQARGAGRVFVRGEGDEHELWRLHMTDPEKTDYSRLVREVSDDAGDWIEIVNRRTGKITYRYPMGYPFPYLPTGYRHAAFQLTDRLVEAGEPVVLPWIDPEWKDFTFRADGTAMARRADGGPDRLAPWRWTQGRLWVQIGDNRKAPAWREVAEHLGMEKPKLWMPADGQRIGPQAPQSSQASTAPATSGTGNCAGAYTGTATWTLGADGKRVWDTSGCRAR